MSRILKHSAWCLAALLMIGCDQQKPSDEAAKIEPPLTALAAELVDEEWNYDNIEWLDPPPAEQAKLSGFAGQYIIIDARRASGVAAPATPSLEIPIGKSITFTPTGIEMEGASCEDWLIRLARVPVLYVDSDPNLIDLTLAPLDSPITREPAGFTVLCEGQQVMQLHRVDDRVLIMPWANSSINLILEKPLSEHQIKAYQAQLKSMKFYDGELTGQLDEETLHSSRAWYEYRAQLEDTQPIPLRPAITENLLDTLGVL